MKKVPKFPRWHHAAGKIDGLIYLFGGYMGVNVKSILPTNDLLVFDPKKKTLDIVTKGKNLKSMPILIKHQCAVLNKNLFFYGGDTI